MTRSQARIDSTRASRDGHEYHEAWVARKCLGLLLPKDDFVGIAIEGFSPGDNVSREATEIADAVLYYGKAATFRGAKRIVVVQVKYSKASELKPFRAADAKKTIEKFARTHRAHKRSHGAVPTRSRLRFELITNRPILHELQEAIVALRDGSTLKGVAKTQANQLIEAIKLHGRDLTEFAARLRVTGIAGDLTQSKHELAIALADWSVARDLNARLRLNNLRNLARAKASLAGQHRNVIVRADVLAELELQHEDELLPVRESFPDVGPVVKRDQLASVVAKVLGLARPLAVHADGGVGKTVFMQSLAAKLSEHHDVVLFDCFGMGQYRATADARHLPQRGMIHITNLLACRGLCDPLLPGTFSDGDLMRSFRSRLTQASETLRSATPDRQLVLLLDAIDNAGEHATSRGETSFPRLLLEDLTILGAIPGVQVVVSFREYRLEKAIGTAKCEMVELQPFIRAAVAFAAHRGDNAHLVPLLVELSTLAAMNQRGTQYLLDNPDLTVAMADAESLRRLFEARTDWPGARHARLTITHVLAGELADATRHAQRVVEWRRHYFDQDREERRSSERPSALDMASIPLCWLARGEGEAAAHDLAGWRDWYGFEVAEKLFPLIHAGAPGERVGETALEAMFSSEAIKPGVLAAAVAHAEGNEALQRQLIRRLASNCASIELGQADYQHKVRPIVRGLLHAAAVAAILDLGDEAVSILDAAAIAVPSLYIFLDDYRIQDIYPFVAAQVLRSLTKNKSLDERDLLPLEMVVAAAKIDSKLQGKELRVALKTVLKTATKIEETMPNSAKRVSRDDLYRADKFLDHRLDAWLGVAQAFAQAMTRSTGGSAGRLRPLFAEWSRLRQTKDYYFGGESAQRQFNAVGERLLTLALAADPSHLVKEVHEYVDSVSATGVTPVSNVIEVVKILARRAPFHKLAGKAAVRAREAIEHLDDVSERVSSFAGLARAIRPASSEGAAQYFHRGLEQVDAVGSGDWEFVSELMHFAASLHGAHLEDADSHTLSNICDLNLGEEQKFDWASYGQALAQAAGAQGIARLARWQDRDRISLDYTLLPYLKSLVDSRELEPNLALIMLRVSSPVELRSCGTAEFVETLLRHPRGTSPQLARELILHYQQNNHGGYGSEDALALSRLAAQALGDDAEVRAQLQRAGHAMAVATDEFNSLNNWRPPTPLADRAERDAEEAALVADAKSRAASVHPLDEAAVGEVLVMLDGQVPGRRVERDLLEELRTKVKLDEMTKYIELIARQEQLDLYDKFHELNACKAAWSEASDAVASVWPRCAAWILQANATEFVSFGQLSPYQLTRLSELTGVERNELVVGLLKEFSRPDVEVPAAVWLSVAASINTRAPAGTGQTALTRLLRSGAAKLAPLVPDGEWMPTLYPKNDPLEVAAGLIWFGLGAPRADRRWMAAHALRSAVRLERSDVLDRVVARFSDTSAGAFGASELPFFYLHAQLWLLIAMARIALDAPTTIAVHNAFLERVAFDETNPHVLRQHFATEALWACHHGGALKLTKTMQAKLRRVNRSPYPLSRRQGTGSGVYDPRPDNIPAPAVEVNLEYDFDKHEVSELARLFDRHRCANKRSLATMVCGWLTEPIGARPRRASICARQRPMG